MVKKIIEKRKDLKRKFLSAQFDAYGNLTRFYLEELEKSNKEEDVLMCKYWSMKIAQAIDARTKILYKMIRLTF